MLDLIRKKQKTIIIKVVFWAIIATFVGTIFLVWGKGSGRSKEDSTVAVTVNGAKIGFDDYQTAYNNLYRLYQNIYRGQFNHEMEKKMKLKQQALDAVIDQALLLQEADRQNISISKQELVDQIAKIPAFQENGTFSKNRYLRILAYQRMTPDQFEASEKHQLLIQKVRDKIQEGVIVTDDDIVKEYRKQNEKVNLDFLKLSPTLFESKVKTDEKAIENFFVDHKEEFRLPETVSIRYILFQPSMYAKDVVFEKGELQKYYDRNLDKFEIPEKVKAAHILIRVPKDADAATRKKKRELAEKILKEARAGKDFAQLARKYSQDPGSASKGGELGYFTRGTMVPEFEKAAFGLKPGEISDIVTTSFGFHIIKVEAHQDSGVKPLDKVLDQVKEGVRAEKTEQIAYEKAIDAYNQNHQGGSLVAAAKANALQVQESGEFSRQGPIEGLGDAEGVISAAFNLQSGELARPLNLPQGVILFTLKDHKESRLPELTEVRAKVEKAWRKQKADELAHSAAKDLLTALQKGKSLDSLARKEGLKVQQTGDFTQTFGDFVPQVGNSADLAKEAFTLTAQKPVAPEVYSVEGDYVVAVLKDRREADMKALDQVKRDQLRESLLNKKKQQVLADRLKELRQKAQIVESRTIQSSLQEK
jgi:peptidyl-prolyl cis-trans isomerase D